MHSNDVANATKHGSNSNNNDVLSDELSRIMNINVKKKKKNTCFCCLKEVEGSMRCSKCRIALYCDRVCQLNH